MCFSTFGYFPCFNILAKSPKSMCGISCVFCDECHDFKCSLEFINKHSQLSRRGPDQSCVQCIRLADETKLCLSGHVLHLRGETVVNQPARHPNGDILLWNGEIFNGIKVGETENDTDILLHQLSADTQDQHILATLSAIQGPWAFIYWQASSETLWFGRDVFGRRSLLWHLPNTPGEELILSSVQIQPWTFREVPSIGLYKLCRQPRASFKDSSNYTLTVFPWQHAVWPGTLSRVGEEEDFTARISEGMTVEGVQFELCRDHLMPSQMPPLNKELPPIGYTHHVLEADDDQLGYLKELLNKDSYLATLSRQLTNVLLEAVKTRVFNQPRHKLPGTDRNNEQNECTEGSDGCQSAASTGEANGGVSTQTVHGDSESLYSSSNEDSVHSRANVAILFSGGIDSTVIAALADKCVPNEEPIDLVNVAFEQKRKETGKKKKPATKDEPSSSWDVPDRLTGYTALSELNPTREWNLINVNITASELQEARDQHIRPLLYPLETVLDDSIGCAVWFAARGHGVLGTGEHQGAPVHSSARVILCGMGADEQLVGYSRHRGRFKEEGWAGLVDEIELEVTRISARNLGRDDRIITDHGKESRFPFLDERVVTFLSALPVHCKADLNLPRGLGEKLLLRLSAVELGLQKTATLPKRAIQFGSRIAKMENSKEKGSDKCARLTQTVDQ